jgi:hypothetical protein
LLPSARFDPEVIFVEPPPKKHEGADHSRIFRIKRPPRSCCISYHQGIVAKKGTCFTDAFLEDF